MKYHIFLIIKIFLYLSIIARDSYNNYPLQSLNLNLLIKNVVHLSLHNFL